MPAGKSEFSFGGILFLARGLYKFDRADDAAFELSKLVGGGYDSILTAEDSGGTLGKSPATGMSPAGKGKSKPKG